MTVTSSPRQVTDAPDAGRAKSGGMQTRNSSGAADAAAVRAARFGTLPEHIAIEDTIEEKPVLSAAADDYNPDEVAARYACSDVDLG